MIWQLLVLSDVLLIVFSFGLGIFTLLRNPQHLVHRTWFFTSLAITMWGSGHLLGFFAVTDAQGLASLKLVYIAAALIPAFFLHFLAAFLLRSHTLLTYARHVGYFLATIFTILTVWTDKIVMAALAKGDLGYFEVPGTLLPFFLAYFVVYMIASIVMLVYGFVDNGGFRRRQIGFVLLATLIAFGGGVTNFLYIYFATSMQYPWGQLVVWLYPVVVTYGIFFPHVRMNVRRV